MNQQISIHPELIKWVADIMGNKDYFGCIYWSYASNTHTKDSDIDFYCAVDTYSTTEMNTLIEFIKDYYYRNNLSLDEEVPFENKLLATYSEVESAIQMGWFELQDNHFIIPKVQKDPVFLGSTEIKKRLILNTLTTPHVTFGNNIDRPDSLKNDAEHNTLLLAINIVNKTKFKVNELIDVLTTSKDGETWEMFLGYKTNKNPISKYLEQFIKKQIDSLISSGVIRPDNNENLCLIKGDYIDNFIWKCASKNINLQQRIRKIWQMSTRKIIGNVENEFVQNLHSWPISKFNIYSL